MTNIMRKKSTLVAAATSEQLAKQTINLFAERAQLSLCWRDPTRASRRLFLISLHPETKETNETLPTAFAAAVMITVPPSFQNGSVDCLVLEQLAHSMGEHLQAHPQNVLDTFYDILEDIWSQQVRRSVTSLARRERDV